MYSNIQHPVGGVFLLESVIILANRAGQFYQVIAIREKD